MKLTKKDIGLIVASLLLAVNLLSGQISPEHKFTIQIICFVGIALIILFSLFFSSKNQDVQIAQETQPIIDYHYKILLDDKIVSLIEARSNNVQSINWNNLTEVYIHSVDSYPVGNMYFELRESAKVLKIPTDADNNKALLKHMQATLQNFNNEALIEATLMLNGTRKLWSKHNGS